jgi:hypothetical protein
MKNALLTFRLGLFVIGTFLINSCASTSELAESITIESGQIPPDMKTEKFTLVGVLQGRNSYDKYLTKEFEAYTGDYVLATRKEIESKYSDVTKYRYLLDYVKETTRIGTGVDSRNSSGYRYFIIDRKDDKKYLRKSRSSFFALEIRGYLKGIESIRKK